MEDTFFSQKTCDRCGGSLANGRTMSMFNTDCICMDCAQAEKQHRDYRKAAEAEHQALMKGDRNFKGIGWPRD